MTLTRFLKNQVTATRLGTGLGVQRTYQALGTYQTMIQPMSDQAHQEFGLAIGTGFHAYFAITTDLKVSDRLTDASGVSYAVTGLRKRGYGRTPHLTAYLVLEPGK